jgi:glycosyltransferase involved in cell wall biosynthesis
MAVDLEHGARLVLPQREAETRAPDASTTHLVLMPSFNTGEMLIATVAAARRFWSPVWVVIDGSTDGSEAALLRRAARDPGLRILHRPRNGGKGAAILDGLRAAERSDFTHALTLDADGQHPTALIPHFMAASEARPDAMILGTPVFAADAPALRVHGRRISNAWANLETLWAGIGDSLFGFRVYPIADLRRIMEGTRWMRRFDFDAEAAVKLSWAGVPAINLRAPVRYVDRAAGGVSHFHYVRDNAVLAWMHARLMLGFSRRLPGLLARRFRSSHH